MLSGILPLSFPFSLYACFTWVFLQAYYFDRSDVALPGLFAYFKKASIEEREHAMKFLTYQNKRGGNIAFKAIKEPATDWQSAQNAMMEALKLEKMVNEVRTGRIDCNVCIARVID